VACRRIRAACAKGSFSTYLLNLRKVIYLLDPEHVIGKTF
jgi:hypothetical protein